MSSRRKLGIPLYGLVALLVLTHPSRGNPLDEWTPILPIKPPLMELTYDAGGWLGVGQEGRIATSETGLEWENHAGFPQVIFESCAIGNGVFLAVGNAIARSTNGVVWSLVPSPESEFRYFSSVAFGNGVFVLAGIQSLFTSPDGLSWEAIALPENVFRVAQVIFAEGKFFAAARPGALMISSDGRNWEVRAAGRSNVAVAVGNGRIVLQSSGAQQTICYASTDGTNWTERVRYPSDSDDSPTIRYGNGYFVSLGRELAFSTDGLFWSPISNAGAYPSALGFGAGQFVATGAGSVAYSTNGYSWVQIYGRPTEGVRKFAFGNDRLVGITQFATYVKLQDQDWRMTSTTGAVDILFHEGVFYQIRLLSPEIHISTNAFEWSAVPVETSLTSRLDLKAIAQGNETFVAVGSDNMIVASRDGRNWQEAPRDPNEFTYFTDVAYGSGVFVAVASAGWWNIAVSEDGLQWNNLSIASATPFHEVAFGNERFVAVGQNLVAVSRDGTNWITASISGYSWALAFGNGIFLSRQGDPSLSQFYFSEDGLNWAPTELQVSGSGKPFYTGGRFIAYLWDLNFEGNLYQSASLNSISLNLKAENGRTSLTATGGETGAIYHLQAAQDLSKETIWRDVFSVTNRNGFFEEIEQPIEVTSPAEFFRFGRSGRPDLAFSP